MLDSELDPGTEYNFDLKVKDVNGATVNTIGRKTLLFTTNDIRECT
jgi:hypothetical protein